MPCKYDPKSASLHKKSIEKSRKVDKYIFSEWSFLKILCKSIFTEWNSFFVLFFFFICFKGFYFLQSFPIVSSFEAAIFECFLYDMLERFEGLSCFYSSFEFKHIEFFSFSYFFTLFYKYLFLFFDDYFFSFFFFTDAITSFIICSWIFIHMFDYSDFSSSFKRNFLKRIVLLFFL